MVLDKNTQVCNTYIVYYEHLLQKRFWTADKLTNHTYTVLKSRKIINEEMEKLK